VVIYTAANLAPDATGLGVLSMSSIVASQSGAFTTFLLRFLVLSPSLFIFFTAAIAETNRAPFDLVEAESEIVGGYHTEYSGFRFAMFFLAEYINMFTVSAVAADLFLGGWHGPFPLPAGLEWIWFLVKVFALLFFYIWMRWTLPRYRYDQLMEFGWKWLLPVAVLNLLVTAFVVLQVGW
jgi:NADH-quinone oxidoreductase subunit H